MVNASSIRKWSGYAELRKMQSLRNLGLEKRSWNERTLAWRNIRLREHIPPALFRDQEAAPKSPAYPHLNFWEDTLSCRLPPQLVVPKDSEGLEHTSPRDGLSPLHWRLHLEGGQTPVHNHLENSSCVNPFNEPLALRLNNCGRHSIYVLVAMAFPKDKLQREALL